MTVTRVNMVWEPLLVSTSTMDRQVMKCGPIQQDETYG